LHPGYGFERDKDYATPIILLRSASPIRCRSIAVRFTSEWRAADAQCQLALWNDHRPGAWIYGHEGGAI